MTTYNIENGRSASFLHGYGSRGTVTGSINIPSFGLASGATSAYSFNMPNVYVDAGANLVVLINGTGMGNVDNRWLGVQGMLSIFKTGVPAYVMQIAFKRDASFTTVLISFYNNTLGASTVPNISISAKVLLYQPPW